MRIAFVPSAPFLLPGFQPFAPVKEAALQAVSALGPAVTVVGAGPVDGPITGDVDPTPWGVPGTPSDEPLPLAHAVGLSLLGRTAPCLSVRSTLVLPDTDLVVVGDGSARRTEKAPGHLDPRAQAYDAQVSAALASGDPALLGALDPVVGADLLAAGVPVWRALAGVLPGSFEAEVLYDDAPFGVGYFCAVWTLVGSAA